MQLLYSIERRERSISLYRDRGARVRRRNLSGSRSLLPGPLAYYEFASYEPMRDRANR